MSNWLKFRLVIIYWLCYIIVKIAPPTKIGLIYIKAIIEATQKDPHFNEDIDETL